MFPVTIDSEGREIHVQTTEIINDCNYRFWKLPVGLAPLISVGKN